MDLREVQFAINLRLGVAFVSEKREKRHFEEVVEEIVEYGNIENCSDRLLGL